MKFREILITAAILGTISAIFFYKSIFLGRIPFPGDLLIAQYKPWRTYSFMGYVPGSYPHKAQYFDTLRQLYPWKTFSIKELSKGTIPLWNPHNFSGSPLLANNQSAVFYPLNVFYFIAPQAVAWTSIMFMGLFLASFGTYLYARTLSISVTGALLAAISYGYCLFVTTFLEYNSIHQTALWLPFALLALELLLKQGMRPLPVIVFWGSVTSAALGGHLQIFAYVIMFSAAYFIFRAIRLKKRVSPFIALIFLLPFGLSAVQLVPTFELITHSARAPQQYQFLIEKLLLQPYQLILVLGGDLFGNPATGNYLLTDSYPGNSIYVGVIPLLFALLSFAAWRKNPFIRLFWMTSVLTLFAMTRSPVTEALYKIPIPFFSTASPTNGIFIFSFGLSVLAGFGIDLWTKNSEKKVLPLLVTTGLILITLWIISRINPTFISTKNLLYSTLLYAASSALLFAGTKWMNIQKYLTIILLVAATLDSWYFFQKFNPFVPRQLIFPSTSLFTWLKEHAALGRFIGIGNANIEANFETQYGLYSPNGYDPLYPKTYGEFMGLMHGGKLTRTFTNATRSDATVPSDDPSFLTDPVRRKTMNLLGVTYVLDRLENANSQTIFPPDSYTLAYEQDGWKIFTNLNAIPRVFLTPTFEIYHGADDFEKKYTSNAFDPSKTVLLETSPDLSINGTSSPGVATISMYTANRVEILTRAPSDQILVLTDTFFPGWKAAVDGKTVDILKADWTFRAISVPEGTHTVVFTYEPSSFSWGAKSSMMSVLIAAGFILWTRKKRP